MLSRIRSDRRGSHPGEQHAHTCSIRRDRGDVELHAPGERAGTYYPWCARYNAYTSNCGFKTWQQCQATVSGAGGYCQQNVMPPPFVESRASGKRKYRRTY
ncbi:MAG: DUF3551 domain-containing protein [Xanthobacteraceae bacterium]